MIRYFVLFVALVVLGGVCWWQAHDLRPMGPAPWPRSFSEVEESHNAYVLLTDDVASPDAFEEILRAAPGERARVFRENEIVIDRALRATADMRRRMDERDRFVLLENEYLFAALTLWTHRTVAVFVEADPGRALAQARSLWRHGVDAAETCSTAVGCAASAKMAEHAMSAAESVRLHFGTSHDPEIQRELAALQREVATAFRRPPTMTAAIENEYHHARQVIASVSCFAFDRGQTETIMQDSYVSLRDYAAGTRTAPPLHPESAFSIFYNPCGRTVAREIYFDAVAVIDTHRRTFDELAVRQEAFL